MAQLTLLQSDIFYSFRPCLVRALDRLREALPNSDIFYAFRPWGIVHAVTLALILVATWGTIRYRRTLPNEDRRKQFDRRLAIAGFVLFAVNQATELWWFELNRSLPLHLCDFAGLLAPLAIFTGRRVWRAMLYYWGIGLSTQALITPELQQGVAQFNFWVFWVPHGMIIVCAVYDLVALHFRPSWKDYGIAIATLAVLLAIILPFDMWFEVNYLFVGQGMPGQASVIDFLGPWPLRVLKLAVGVVIFLAVITLPWELVRRRRESREARAPVEAGDWELGARS